MLIGGSPSRIVRLKPAGTRLLDAWLAGETIGTSTAERRVAGRLVDSGIAHPLPPRGRRRPGHLGGVVAVVPVKDDAPGLEITLASLAAEAPELPVVVVDDGSSSPVAGPSVVTRPSPVTGPSVVTMPRNGGPAAARNAGWERTPDVEVLVFVDAGCVLEPDCLSTILAHFADPLVGAVAPRVKSRDGTPRLGRYERAHSPLDMGGRPAAVRPGASVAYVPTAVLAVRRTALCQLGGFDEQLRFGEDVDLIWRLDAAGWRVRYEPAGRATHPARTTTAGWLRQRFDYGRSAAPLARRHRGAVAPLAAPPAGVAGWLLAASGHPWAAAALTAGAGCRSARIRPEELKEIAALIARGHLRTGSALASAVRRAWLPLALAALVLTRRRRRFAAWLALILVAPGLLDWVSRRSPGDDARGTDPLSWTAMSLADDLAYQCGLWAGALHCRSVAALLPDLEVRRLGAPGQ